MIKRLFQSPIEACNIRDTFYSIRQKGEEASDEHFNRNLKHKKQVKVRMRKPKDLLNATVIS